MISKIYRGWVMHARTWEAKHKFKYPFYFYAFDLDELDELNRQSSFFGYNRIRLVALHDKDYLAPGREPVKEKILKLLKQHGCDDDVQKIFLITSLRFLNYTFNPVSFFYCVKQDGSLRAVIVNVNNTFKDSHIYVLKEQLEPRPGFVGHYKVNKEFHVSPFFDISGYYEFFFSEIGDSFDVQIRLHKEETIAFIARMQGRGIEFSTSNLLKTIFFYPLTGLMTMTRIHFQAARLYWQRKLPIYSRPNPTSKMTVRFYPPKLSRKIAAKGVMKVLQKIKRGELELVLPDRTVKHFGEQGSKPFIHADILNWNFFWRIAKASDIGLGEAYMAGDWQCSDLAGFIQLLIKNKDCIKAKRGGFYSRTLNYFKHLCRPNTIPGSRKNIKEHYDLSNDFFQLFLDDSMMYSCALFDLDKKNMVYNEIELAKAQKAKLQRIIEKAQIGPEDHVLEIGCGWGSFAIEAAKTTGCKVTGITVSEEQLKFARQKVAAAGLDDQINIELCDYRKIQGEFSRIVSIEMLEAVGHKFLGQFFAAVDRLLTPDGQALIQVITIPDERYNHYCRNSDFIRKHIFPGGHLPSLDSLNKAVNLNSQLKIQDIDQIGLHYVPTLRIWRKLMLGNSNEIKKLGFDDVFLRKWEFYFAYCEAAFAEKFIDDLQFLLKR